jgi:2-methylisocitrate lyase-like PEP mutase family enzyme
MTSFKDLHRPGDPLLLPNAWDAVTGAALAAAGFEAIGTTSLGVAAAVGKRDAAGDTWEETLALARRLVTLDCHVTVDFEGGFSDDPEEVAERVAGLGPVAGINLEDGHGNVDRHARKIAAVKARTPDIFVNARTDTHWLRDGDLDDAIARCRRYVDAGADGVFVPGLPREDIEAFVAAVPAPLNVLYAPGNLAELGVARISTGSLLFRTALQATVNAAIALRGEQPRDVPSYTEVEGLAARSRAADS